MTDLYTYAVFQVSFAPSPLVAAVLPGSRSVKVGTAATIFATMINSGATDLAACGAQLSPLSAGGVSLSFQTTDPATNALTGSAGQPVAIPAGKTQTFLLAFDAKASVTVLGFAPVFFCDNVAPAPTVPGADTVDLLFSATPVSDIIALSATATDDGTLHVAGGAGAFAVATIDAGAAGDVTVTADTGSATLPVMLSLCQTNATTGQCLAPPAASLPVSFTAGGTPTFSVFASTTGQVPFAPGTSRIFVRFADAGGTSHGSTSVAVTTN